MKRPLLTLFIVLSTAAAISAQARFPGLSPEVKKQLATAKRSVPFALPTWVPAGFTLKEVQMNLGPRVKIEDRQLIIVYSRNLANGKTQRFAFEAGFDGLGDLMYDSARMLRTPVGKISLQYQPKDEDGKKLMDYSMTEWFNVGRTAFHYDGMYDAERSGASVVMISLADTEKILRSLNRY